METCNELFAGGKIESPEAMYHVSQALTLVNQRLKSKAALDDSTVTMIVMLILQEQIRKENEQINIHFEGLRKVITLRGGLDQLKGNSALQLKICK